MDIQRLFDSFDGYFEEDYEESYLDCSKIHEDVRSIEMPFSQFVKFIYNQIDPANSILITKDMLLMIEKAFVLEFGDQWNKLTRKDKRKKERILKGLYSNFNLLYSNIKSDPDKYLRFTKELIIKKYIKDQKAE